MSKSAEFIRAEIAKRENEIKGLRMALEILEDAPPRAAAKKPGRKGRGDHMKYGTYTVNGVDLHLGKVQFCLLEKLDHAEDCVPRDTLEAVCDGDRKALHQAIFNLKTKLKPAGATIEWFDGEGYRLQNIEDSA